MPRESEGLDHANTLIEYRGIRCGQRAQGKAPVKTPPRVRHTLKPKGSDYFDIDVPVMKAIAARLKLDPENWKKVKEVPIFLMSDLVSGEGGVLFSERALYSRRGRLCGSAMGAENAVQRIDISAYAKSKGKDIKQLKQFVEKPCTDECPVWGKDGEKTDCKWRMVVTMQLADDPIFPSPVYHRTTSRYTQRSLFTCLTHISAITGGILTGIPLWFRQTEIKVRDRDGKDRIIPVNTIEFKGTVAELRRLGLKQHQLRNAITEASAGKVVSAASLSFGNVDLGHGELIDDEADDVGDVAGPAGQVEVPKSSDDEAMETAVQLQSDVAKLGKKLGYTKARMDSLSTKHEGDLQGMLAELRAEDPDTDFNPSPGAPAREGVVVEDDVIEEEPPPAAAAAVPADDDDDDITDLFE